MFVVVAVVFFLCDVFVQVRDENLVSKAAQSNAVVSSLFPDAMRDVLLNEAEQRQNAKKEGNLKVFLNDRKDGSAAPMNASSKPMAGLPLDTQVATASHREGIVTLTMRLPHILIHASAPCCV